MIRRLLLLVLMTSLLLPAPARADDGLADYLEAAMEADFYGEGMVMSTWGHDSAATTYDVTRSNGMSMVHGPEGGFMFSGGVTASESGTDWYAVEVGEWSAWSLSDRYSLGQPVPTTRLGRPATEVVVREDGQVRARLVIDDESTVPLLTEVLAGDGSVFRVAAMVEFSSATPDPVEMPEQFMEHEMLMHGEDSPRLPDSVFGYGRTDTYAMTGRATQAFYSDGLFSFSLFELGRGVLPAEFSHATRFEVDGDVYSRIVTPGNVWVQWSTPDHSYVMAGDLPPDHIERVLAELPRPGMRGVVTRLLMRLFG